MWIIPRAHSSPGMFWIKVRENEFYEMLEAKGGANSGTLLGGVVSVVLASSDKNALKYRIVLKSSVPQVVAVSNSYDQILKHWFFTEELLTKANTIDAEANEKQDFMLAKLASVAETAEEEEEDQNSEYYISKFHRDFSLGDDQKLLTYFRCSLWDTIPTKGILFVTKDFTCYTSGTPHRVRVAVAFRDILSISKESTLGFFSNSIKIVCCDEKQKTKKRTYYITFILREEAYSMLSQLWQRAIEHLENPLPPSPSISSTPSDNFYTLGIPTDDKIPQNTTTSSTSTSTSTTTSSPSVPSISVSSVSSVSYPSPPSPPPSFSSTNSTNSTDSPAPPLPPKQRRHSKPLPPLPSDSSSSLSHSPSLTLSSADSPSPLYPSLYPSLSTDSPSVSSTTVESVSSSVSSLNLNTEIPPSPSVSLESSSLSSSSLSSPSLSSPTISSTYPPSPNLALSNDPSKYGLDRERRNADFQAIFKLPASESLMEEYWCSVWRKSYIVGKLYVSRNFCCFHAGINKELTIVLSFYQIGSIQKERSMGFISNAIKVITLNNREFFFVLYNRDGAFITMDNLWKSHVQSNRKVKVPPLVDIGTFGWSVAQETLPRESEELINHKKQLWNKYFKKNGFSLEMIKTQKLREMIRNGVNSDLRGPVWVLCSGAIYSWEADPSLYSSLLERHKNQVSTATEEIEKDLHRTLAYHAYFQTPEAIEQLRNVLTAYSWRNPSIGYCQAMNVVCAAMLMHTTEEASFWLMSVICEDLLKGYYNTAMIGSIVDQKIFENLTESYFPKLYAHLNKVGLPITILSLPWFMCLFIGYIPWEVAMRVIDSIFYEGSLVLFQAGLAVLKLNQDAILQEEDSERIVEMLKKRQYDSELIMQVTFRDFEFAPDKLTELRNAHKYKTVRHIN